MNKLDELENQMENDTEVKDWKWKPPRRFRALEKKNMKKSNADKVLVEYLTQKQTVRRMLCKVVAGNIIVIDNKVHMLNPKDTWRDGKSIWYKIREIDRLPVSNRDYDKLIRQKRITVNDAVVIKAIVGAIQKKELGKEAKKWIIWIIVLAVAGFLAYIFFFAK